MSTRREGRERSHSNGWRVSERPCMHLHAGLLRMSLAPAPLSEDARRPGGLACDPAPARGRVMRARTQAHQPRPFQRPDRSLKADWLDERSTSDGAVRQRVDPARPGGLRFSAPTDRPLHHPRPGIYNAVLRSDRFGTGHRLGIQNAPAGGPLQITDHMVYTHTHTHIHTHKIRVCVCV